MEPGDRESPRAASCPPTLPKLKHTPLKIGPFLRSQSWTHMVLSAALPQPHSDLRMPENHAADHAQALSAHLRALVRSYVLRDRNDLVARACGRALERFDLGDAQTAAELFAFAADANNIQECAFLGAALANSGRDHVPAARIYASQALTLHCMLGDGSLADAYERLIVELSPAKIDSSEPAPVPEHTPELAADNAENPWYWQFARRHPRRGDLVSPEAFDKYFFDGLVPSAPYLSRADRIGTIGSCFAQNIASRLTKLGYQTPANTRIGTSEHVYVTDNFFNTFVIREAFEYAFGLEADREHWIADGASDPVRPNQISYTIDTVRSALEKADVYVVTLGLAEVWFNRNTGVVYPGGVNIDAFDPQLHGFRVSSVEENFENIRAIYDLIRSHRPHATVIFTLSPVPLGATFRAFNCVAANSVSKAVLRLAIDRLMEDRREDDRLFYYPSYEIVRDYFANPYGSDMRHVKDKVIAFVMDQFLRKFFVD